MPTQSKDSAAAQPQKKAGAHQKNLARPSAEEIYKQVATSARQELKRSSLSLAISGIGGGIFMGLSALGTALILSLMPASNTAHLLSRMLYPLGFIVVILGRSQLFTENTLYPVALVLAEKRHLWNTLRLWSVVLPANVLGAFGFACLASLTPTLPPEVLKAITHLGVEALGHPAATIFWTGVMGGWIIALTAWLVSGSHSITGSIMMVWLLTYVVGLGNFAHCIATSGEIFAAILTHQAPGSAWLRWFVPAVLGNICGGVIMVTILEYGQVIAGEDEDAAADAMPGQSADKLSVTPA